MEALELLKNAPRQAAARRVGAARPAPAEGASGVRSEGIFAEAHTGTRNLQKNASEAPADAGATEQSQKTAVMGANIQDRASENTALPKAWEAVLEKVKPAPIIWTYEELGEDLMVRGDQARSRALRELIGSLGLKGGTSAFLPAVLPGRPDDGSDAWCFQAMLGRLGGRILVSFGSGALALGPYAPLGLEPFREKIVQGRIILCLPAFKDILADPARFEATKVFLRSAFAKINIL